MDPTPLQQAYAAFLDVAMGMDAEHKRVRHFRQRGMIFAFDAIEPDAARASSFARRFFTAAVENELLLRPIGRTVYVMPPYVLDEEAVELLGARVQSVFESVIGR